MGFSGLEDYLSYAPVASFIFAVTVFTSVWGLVVDGSLIDRFILHPWSVVHERQLYRVFTSALIHASWIHLIVNLITYYFFVFLLEPTIGHWQFAVIYVGSLVAANLSPIFRNKDNVDYYALGASGAISGALFSMILYLIHNPYAQILLFFVIPIPTWLFPILYIAYSYWAFKNSRDNIGHDAHLWGAVAGFILTLILDPQAGIRLVDFIRNQLQRIIG